MKIDKNSKKTIDNLIELMASTGEKSLVYADIHNKNMNKISSFFSFFVRQYECGISDEKIDRFIEFEKRIGELFDEFMKAEGIEC